jgi:signal transduction histidine kinase
MATILAIDDRPDDLRLVSTLLRAGGHEVITAESPLQALALIAEQPPDLVVSDILMPELDGLELLRRLRSNGASATLRFVFCSALYNDELTNALAQELGVSALFTKPLDPTEFLAQITSVLDAAPPPVPPNEAIASQRLNELNALLFEKLEALEFSNRELDLARAAERDARLRANQQAAIVKLGVKALRNVPIDELVDEAISTLRDGLGVPLVRVLDVMPGDAGLQPRAGIGWPIEAMQAVVPMNSIAAKAFAADEAVVVDALPPGGPAAAQGAVCGVVALCGSPSDPKAVVTVYSTEHRRFSGDDLFFVQSVANVLAEAMTRSVILGALGVKVAELSRSDGQRKHLIKRLLTAQEEERQRIAADVHDDSAQVMTALVLRLGLLERQAHDPVIEASIREISDIARRSISRLRHLIFELRPPALEHQGLASALRQYLEELRDDAGFEVAVECDFDVEPAIEIGATIYRIAQEALTNVVKHAEATHVEVRLTDRDGGILAVVADDGRGFAIEMLESAQGHFGVVTMEERAKTTGGWWRIESEPGAGTTVHYWIPLEAGQA